MTSTNEATNLHPLNNTSQILTTAPDDVIKMLEIAVIVFNRWTALLYIPLGIFGNLTSLIITTKKENRTISTCVFMSALAVMDTFVLLSAFFYKGLFGHGFGDNVTGPSRRYLLVLFWYISYTFAMASGLYLALMSLDRAIAIVFPLQAKTICTASRAKKAVTVTFLIPAIPNISIFFTYDSLLDKTTGIETAILNYPEPPWVEMVISGYFLSFGTIIPFVVIMTCNIIIIAHVQRAARTRGKMAEGSSKAEVKSEKHLTRMLILVSMAYVVLSIPLRFYDVMLTIPAVNHDYDMSKPYWQLRYSLQFWVLGELWNSNFAVNFYLYFLGGGKKFRNDAKQVYMCCVK